MKAHKCNICGKKWHGFHPEHSEDDTTWDDDDE